MHKEKLSHEQGRALGDADAFTYKSTVEYVGDLSIVVLINTPSVP
jgi:hypothetical protein